MIKLYHTNCPVCRGVEMRLKSLKLDFESIEGEENIIKLGFSSSPVIECDGKYYVGGAECMKFINSLR